MTRRACQSLGRSLLHDTPPIRCRRVAAASGDRTGLSGNDKRHNASKSSRNAVRTSSHGSLMAHRRRVRCRHVRAAAAIRWCHPTAHTRSAAGREEVLGVEFGLLGPLVVRDGTRHVSVSAPRQRVLLAALLLSAGRVVSLDALAEVLWEGEPPAGARGALHSAVQRLRSTLGPSGADLIETRPPGYLITVDDGEFDVREFSVLAARGHAAAEAGTWAQAASLLREALGLWRGEPLADVPSQLLRDREVPPIEDQRLQALATADRRRPAPGPAW